MWRPEVGILIENDVTVCLWFAAKGHKAAQAGLLQCMHRLGMKTVFVCSSISTSVSGQEIRLSGARLFTINLCHLER